MRPLLLLFISGILLCVLLAGCAVAPIREMDGAANAPTIAETLGNPPAGSDAGGKQLASKPLTETITVTAAADVALSTPDLIEAAYASGEISEGERTLYLAYAIYDPIALPAPYQSSAPWRGTMIVSDIKETVASQEFCAFSQEIQEELRRLLADSVEYPTCS